MALSVAPSTQLLLPPHLTQPFAACMLGNASAQSALGLDSLAPGYPVWSASNVTYTDEGRMGSGERGRGKSESADRGLRRKSLVMQNAVVVGACLSCRPASLRCALPFACFPVPSTIAAPFCSAEQLHCITASFSHHTKENAIEFSTHPQPP
jgi:hypothetical protein